MTPPHDAAQEYLRRGWIPVPLPPGEKGPRLKGWPDLRPTDAELPGLFADAGGVGLLLGKPSGGLTDVDLDCTEALVLADAFLPPTTMEHGRASTQRAHRWYLCDPPAPKNERFTDADGAVLAELHGTGRQTMVPPSRHPETGEELRFNKDGEPAKVGGPTLRDAVATLAAASLLARHWPAEGSRERTALALAGTLLRASWSEAKARNFIAAVARAADDPEAVKREHAVADSAKRLHAGQAVTGLPDLAKCLQSEAVVSRVRDWLGLKPSLVLEELATRSKPAPVFRTVEELRAMPESKVDWIVEEILGVGRITVIASGFKVGKSVLVTALLHCMETGQAFAGFAVPAAATAVYLSEEAASGVLEKCDKFGVERAVFLVREDFDPRLTFREFMEAAVAEAKRRGARVIFVDTWRRFSRLGTDADKDSGAVQAVIEVALEMAAREQIAVCVLAHHRKAEGDGGTQIAGSFALGAAVDVLIEVRRFKDDKRSPCRVLSFEGRSLTLPSEEVVLELKGTEYLRAGRLEDYRIARMKDRILAEVDARAPDRVPRKDCIAAAGGKGQDAGMALAELRESGVLTREGAGKSGSPHTYARRSEDSRFPSLPVASGAEGSPGRFPVPPLTGGERETGQKYASDSPPLFPGDRNGQFTTPEGLAPSNARPCPACVLGTGVHFGCLPLGAPRPLPPAGEGERP